MNEESRNPDPTLAVLAGGAGSRMGGPKASLQIQGHPILRYLAEQFAWRGRTMLVLAPDTDCPPASDRFDLVFFDPIAGVGPLRGVLTALEHATSDIVVIPTVDMPGIQHEQ